MRFSCREVVAIVALMFQWNANALQRGIPVGEGVYPSVVRLIIADGVYQTAYCTGTILKNKYILTSAHCFDAFKKVDGKDVYYQRKNGLYSAPGISDLKNHCHRCFRSFENVQIHPLYTYRDIPHDVAVIPLSEDAKGSDEFFFVGNARSSNFIGHLVAFGRSSTDDFGDWMKRQGNVNVAQNKDGGLVSLGDSNPFRSLKGQQKVNSPSVATTPGNSGTALTVDGSGKIVGLVSAGYCIDLEKMAPHLFLLAPSTHDCPYVYQAAASYYVDLTSTDNQAFLKRVMGENFAN